MGTRGLFGWVVDNKLVCQYNHFDSYPSGKGIEFLGQLRKLSTMNLEEVKERLRKVKEISTDSPMKKEDYEKYEKFGCAYVGGNSMANEVIRDWQQLLHQLQGNLMPYFTGEVEHIENSAEFMKDSLFCEWAYVVNLDTGKLEIYEGFQKKPHSNNKYFLGHFGDEGYYPVKMIREYPLEVLPTDEELCELERDEDE